MNPLPGDLFARRLRQERDRLNVSQAELGRRITEILGMNVDPSAVTRIEQQTRTVRLDEAVAAAEALDVPLPLLLSDNSAAENEAQLRSKAIQVLTGGTDAQSLLEPQLRDAIDAQVPAEEDEDDRDDGVTGPGA